MKTGTPQTLNDTLHTLFAWGYVTQCKMYAHVLKKIPNRSLKGLGEIFDDAEFQRLAHRMQMNISLLPAFPGSDKFKHNLKYTVPFHRYFNMRIRDIT